MELQFSMERRMLNRLLLETAFLRDTGLFHGQTGIILGFALLYERTSDEIYKEIMDVLLDRMTERLTNDLSINFDKGIAGIGWGMEYLIQNRLVEGDSLEVCKEFDERIVRENVRRMTDLSLETGLEGLLHYITAHLQGVWNQSGRYPFDGDFLKDVYVAACRTSEDDIPVSLMSLCAGYRRFYESGKVPRYTFDFIKWIEVKTENAGHGLGLKNGLAGLLLKKIVLNEKGVYIG